MPMTSTESQTVAQSPLPSTIVPIVAAGSRATNPATVATTIAKPAEPRLRYKSYGLKFCQACGRLFLRLNNNRNIVYCGFSACRSNNKWAYRRSD